MSLLLAAPALAAPTPAPTPAARYVRFRAAEAAGALDAASAQMAALLTADARSDVLAASGYRQGLAAGDRALALRAARLLDAAKALPPDAPLLFFIEALRAKDWTAARAEVDRLEAGRLFAFLAPILRAWIAAGEGDADPLAALEPARTAGMASSYYAAQRVLLLVATGRLDEAAAAARAIQAAGPRLKLIVAAALDQAGRAGEAKALVSGSETALIEARARLAAGRPIGLALDGAGGGVSELLGQVAVDLNRQRLAPVALTMARLATFADPDNSGAWIAAASLLGAAKKQAAGLAALDHVAPGDPFAGDAATMRVSLMIDAGDKDAALARALAATKMPGADADDWARAGDVYLALDRPKEAAAAYADAVAGAAAWPTEQLWPLYAQLGTALEQAGDWPGARAALDKAATLAPDQPVVLNHLGYSLLARREDMARAAALIEQASRLRPDDPAITDSSGWARFVAGDARAALPLLETAAAGDPADPTINEHLGDVYWTSGRRVEARYAWRAAEVGAAAKDRGRLAAKIADGLSAATASP